LGKLYPLKYVPVHKAAYDHTYMIETFGHNHPNPILQYNNNHVPMTEDGKIDFRLSNTYPNFLILPKTFDSVRRLSTKTNIVKKALLLTG